MLVLAWLLPPAVGAAQDQKDRLSLFKWWKRPAIAEALELSDNEKNRLDELYVDFRRKAIDFRATIARERLDMDQLLEQNQLDEAAILKHFGKVEAARSACAPR